MKKPQDCMVGTFWATSYTRPMNLGYPIAAESKNYEKQVNQEEHI